MTNKEIDPKNIPEISEDYKFLDFEKFEKFVIF